MCILCEYCTKQVLSATATSQAQLGYHCTLASCTQTQLVLPTHSCSFQCNEAGLTDIILPSHSQVTNVITFKACRVVPHSCNVPPYNSTHKQNCRVQDQFVDNVVNSPVVSKYCTPARTASTIQCAQCSLSCESFQHVRVSKVLLLPLSSNGLAILPSQQLSLYWHNRPMVLHVC